MNLDKDPSSWARINPVIVANWHPTEVQNFVAMALGDIGKLAAELESEQNERRKLDRALREKDAAMGVLFDRLSKAGVDCSDLIS